MRPMNAEPGDDMDRSDSQPHRRNDPVCACDDCVEERATCEECKGNGTRWEYVEGGFLERVDCVSCHGTGRCEEA